MQGMRQKNKQENSDDGQGLQLLQQPVLPLIHMVQFLFLTGSFDRVAEIVAELPSPIETAHATYQDPASLVHGYLDLLVELEKLKQDTPITYLIVDENGQNVDRMTAISSWVNQQILTRELERINSLLCAPCSCTLCCRGPDAEMKQEFFEIPLTDQEARRFAIPAINTDASRQVTAMTEPSLKIDHRPFYDLSRPALFNWKTGWSLIMARETHCPNLEIGTGRCLDYLNRPEVCRRPQIFPYLLERIPEYDRLENDREIPAYRLRQTLLAVTDCPYVRHHQDDIATYAAACELELIFKQNKA